MLFGWQTVKHVMSNAVLFANGTETVSVGAGQLSRVDAVKVAKMKAESDAEGKTASSGSGIRTGTTGWALVLSNPNSDDRQYP